MKKIAVIPAVIAAAATSGIAFGAATAQAAGSCANATVSISPSTVLTPGERFAIVGHGFLCAAGLKVNPQVFNTAAGQQGNGPQVAVDSKGDFTDSELAPQETGYVTVRIDGPGGAVYTNTKAVQVVASSTAAPTAVPAGHVDVTRNSGSDSDTAAIAGLGVAGLALLGAGVATGARRRPARRLNG